MRFVLALLSFCVSLSAHANLSYNLVEGHPNIYLDPLSEKIGCTWMNGVVWDKPLIQKFYSLLAQQSDPFVVLDLGAQTGSFSLLAKYFPRSHWYAFEPIQEAAFTLEKNLMLNSIHNVSVYQTAVSDTVGKAILKMPNLDAWGLATLGKNVLRFNPLSEREVDCTTLDQFVNENQVNKVHFMKIDTEGWELYILRGAKDLILRDRPVILMEFNATNMRQCNVTQIEIENFLRSMNYEWELISTEDILCTPR